MLVNVDHLLAHWPNLTPNRFNLRIEPSEIPALLTALQGRFSLDDSRIVDQARLKGWSTQVFERTFAATAALNSLTLAVAGVALFISLLTQSQSRLGQLAPLWALGVTRRQLMLLNLGQTWLLALLAVGPGVAAGHRPGLVPGHGDQRAGLRLAPAVAGVPVATGAVAGPGDARHATGIGLAAVCAVPHAAGGFAEDFAHED